MSSHFGIPDKTADATLEGSTDVIAYVEENKTIHEYVATVFTYDEIQAQKEHNAKQGIYLDGMYFFKKNLLIVESCTYSALVKIVNHLIQEGDFLTVFRKY